MPQRHLLIQGIITHWVFDLDGTLTLPIHDFSLIKRLLQIPDYADILDFLKQLPVNERQKRYALLHSHEEELADAATAAPGAVALITALYTRGDQLGIVTRNSRSIASRTLHAIGLSDYFDTRAIIGRDEAEPKPNPAGIRALQKQWGASLAEMVMVGDYIHDLAAGKAASIATIHVSRPDKQRWPEASDVMVEDLAEVLDLITQMP